MVEQHKNSNNAIKTYKAPKKTNKKWIWTQSLTSTSIAQILNAKFPNKISKKLMQERKKLLKLFQHFKTNFKMKMKDFQRPLLHVLKTLPNT
jgi:N12 class adenine-specific DNA methylase